MAYNTPSEVPIVQRPPTRIVPGGIVTVPAGKSLQFPGSANKQARIQFFATCMDAGLPLYLQTFNGGNFLPLFPQRPLTIETDDDIQIFNPNATDVQAMVGELYPGTGNMYGVPRRLAAAIAGGGAGAGTGSGSGTASGGGTVSGGGGGHQGQTP